MPAPVVYVLAALATVGTIWAFKQLVYDPHIHDHVVTWVEGMQETRRRRARGLARPHAAHGNDSVGDEAGQPLIPMQTGRQERQHTLRRRRQQSRGGSEDGHDSDEERYGVRDAPRSGRTSSRMNEYELPDLAPEVREWSRASVVEGSRSPLDESNYSIPFATLQPYRGSSGSTQTTSRSPTLSASPTHVIGNADSPASMTAATTPTGTPSMSRRMQALPQVPPQAQGPSSSVLFSTSDHQVQTTEPSRSGSPAHTDLSSLVTSPPLPTLPPITHITPTISLDIPRHLASNVWREPDATPTTGSFATPIAETPIARPILPTFPSESASIRTLSSRESTASASPTSYRQTFPAHSPASSRTASTGSPHSPSQQRRQSSSPTHSRSPPLRPAFIPSLSQIYPQDLDSEHNVVLLSPPSSRSESPFSVVSSASEANSPSAIAAVVNGVSYRSPLIEQGANGGEYAEPRTPGSTATSYLSLGNSSPSSPISTPTSPFVPLSSSRHGQGGFSRRGGSDEEDGGSEFDFDIISDTTSFSALNSPTNPSSPFSMSPFASPRMGGPSVHGVQHPEAHHEQSNRTQQRPTSPAVSTTSTTSLSELDMIEHDDAPWENVNRNGQGQGQGTLRRFPGRGPRS